LTTIETAALPAVEAPSSPGRRRRVPASLSLYVGSTLLAVILLAGLFLPLRYGATTLDTNAVSLPPSADHWFGTDEVGQDMFARTVRAARTDLPLAIGGTALATVLGVAGGLAVSSKRRWSEWIMRGLDAFQSLPLLILTIALVVISNNNIVMVAVAVALVSGPFYIRIVRSQAVVVRESRFIEAAITSGASTTRVMWKHMLPNLRAVILAQTALTGAVALLVVASLSFIGVGVVPPTPSWGAMIRGGAGQLVTGQWWAALFPGLALFSCIISFNLIADGLRDRAGRRRSAGST
jgi:peptide/nickel transport system permease protein